MIRVALSLAVLAVVAGCAELTRWDPDASAPVPQQAGAPPGMHIVQRGDTLFKIAFTYRLDWRDLAAWNRLSNADRIYPGQQIRLTPPGTAAGVASRPPPATGPATGTQPGTRPPPSGTQQPAPQQAPRPAPRPAAGPPPAWRWPADGPLVWQFGESRRNPTGIGIGGGDGHEVRAAADGEVVYSGSGLIGYGQLIILKHNDAYLSAYGYNQSLRVVEGEHVRTGQVIALMGRGPADRPSLHFEIRVDGKPVDPARYLPSRQGIAR